MGDKAMEVGQTVYRGAVRFGIADNCTHPYYMDTATVTGIEIDGAPLVRFCDILIPGKNWFTSEHEAKQAVVNELTRHVGTLQAVIDKLKDEILHEQLTVADTAA